MGSTPSIPRNVDSPRPPRKRPRHLPPLPSSHSPPPPPVKREGIGGDSNSGANRAIEGEEHWKHLRANSDFEVSVAPRPTPPPEGLLPTPPDEGTTAKRPREEKERNSKGHGEGPRRKQRGWESQVGGESGPVYAGLTVHTAEINNNNADANEISADSSTATVDDLHPAASAAVAALKNGFYAGCGAACTIAEDPCVAVATPMSTEVLGPPSSFETVFPGLPAAPATAAIFGDHERLEPVSRISKSTVPTPIAPAPVVGATLTARSALPHRTAVPVVSNTAAAMVIASPFLEWCARVKPPAPVSLPASEGYPPHLEDTGVGYVSPHIGRAAETEQPRPVVERSSGGLGVGCPGYSCEYTIPSRDFVEANPVPTAAYTPGAAAAVDSVGLAYLGGPGATAAAFLHAARALQAPPFGLAEAVSGGGRSAALISSVLATNPKGAYASAAPGARDIAATSSTSARARTKRGSAAGGVKSRKNRNRPQCAEESCKRRPLFGVEGTRRARFCSSHKEPGMTNVMSRRCEIEGCKHQPSFGALGFRAARCAAHKAQGMVNVLTPSCVFSGCPVCPSFGKPGDKKPSACAAHRSEGDVDLVTRRCHHEGCVRRPVFGRLQEKKSYYCESHKLYGMVNVFTTRCEAPDCRLPPAWSLPDAKKPTHCVNHRDTLRESRRWPMAEDAPGCTA